MAWLNNRPFAKLIGTRRVLFEQLDRPADALRSDRYQFATWKTLKVNIDYHVDVDRYYYSVPYQPVGQRVDVRISERTVEAFFSGPPGRCATDAARSAAGYSTQDAHMPERHRAHLAWNPNG